MSIVFWVMDPTKSCFCVNDQSAASPVLTTQWSTGCESSYTRCMWL